jgi:hypothetical protein
MAILPTISAQPNGSSLNEQTPTPSGINSPMLSPKGKVKQRAISDIAQVFNIIGNLQQARRSQNEKNGRIQEKLNSERPYREEDLKAEGLGYKSNFSTKPLSTTVGKVSSRLTKAVQAARYLTSSELPDSIPEAKKKTELFRQEITNCVRRWPGWYDFLSEVAAETSTFGWTTVAWLDTDSWKPVHFRQDKAFLPDGTKHSVDTVQFAAFLQYIMPHELANLVRGEDGSEEDLRFAKDAGWDLENTFESINNARPPSIPAAQSAPYTDFRRYADALRESSVTLSLVDGAKQVMLWHVFATEIDGKISHYMGDGNTQKMLFEKEDRFDKIEDCLALLSYEQGNGLLMGSKGIGREIYEISNIVDRSRNEAVDRLQMSGKLIITGPENKINRFKLSVVGNVCIIPDGFTLQQNKIESGATDFIALDGFLTKLLDQIAGGVTPRTFERERVTSTEVNLYASREEEKRDDIDTRFVTKLGAVISTMQRRIISDSTDEDSKRVREKLLNYMSEEEMEQLAEQPALRTVEDYTMSDTQKIVAFADSKRQDPLYNQTKLQRRAAAALINAEFADDVILPENDPVVIPEQAREQLIENLVLVRGTEVPISPRDNHPVHRAVLKDAFKAIGQAAGSGDQKALAIAEVFLKHWSAHLEAGLAAGEDKKQLQPEIEELKAVAQQIGEMQAHAAAGVQPGQPQGAPGQPQNQPQGQPQGQPQPNQQPQA